MPTTSTTGVRVKVDSDTRSLDLVIATLDDAGGQVTVVAERPEGRRSSWSVLPGHAWLVVTGLNRHESAHACQMSIEPLTRRGSQAEITVDDVDLRVVLEESAKLKQTGSVGIDSWPSPVWPDTRSREVLIGYQIEFDGSSSTRAS